MEMCRKECKNNESIFHGFSHPIENDNNEINDEKD
jgi:hypothetical protein